MKEQEKEVHPSVDRSYQNKQRLSLLLFSIGIFMGMLFYTVNIWTRIEAAMFDAAMISEARFRDLKCPLMLTTAESGIVSATFNNPSERTAIRTVRTRISYGYVTFMREEHTRLSLAPGETQRLQWLVTPEDAAWGRLILVRVHALPSSPYPYETEGCGILVLNVPFLTGAQIAAAILLVSLLGIGGGLGLWVKNNQPLYGQKLRTTYTMVLLAGVVLAGILFSLIGWWMLGIFLLVLNVLLLLGILTATTLGAT